MRKGAWKQTQPQVCLFSTQIKQTLLNYSLLLCLGNSSGHFANYIGWSSCDFCFIYTPKPEEHLSPGHTDPLISITGPLLATLRTVM